MILTRIVGLFFLVAGSFTGLVTLISLGFATMIDSRLDRAAWWAEYGVKIWNHGLVALGLLACLLVGLGSWLLLIRIDSPLTPHEDDQLGPIGSRKLLDDRGGRDEYFYNVLSWLWRVKIRPNSVEYVAHRAAALGSRICGRHHCFERIQ